MRIFIALDLDPAIRERIQRFMDGVREFAPDARWVRTESVHVTLKFIGEKPDAIVEQVKGKLRSVQGKAVEMTFRGYGFFPNARSARVFWVGIEAGPQLEQLARDVENAAFSLGIEKEAHAFSPHLTLARAGGGSGNPRWQKGDRAQRCFERLQQKLAALPAPEFGSMTAGEFYLYQSQLSRDGSRYTRLERFELKA